MGTAIDRHTRIQSLNKEPSHVHTINTKPLDAKFHWWRRFEFACGVRRRGVVRIFWTVVLVLRVLPPLLHIRLGRARHRARCYRCLELGLLCFEDCGATLWPSITSPLESCGENQHSCTARGCSFAPLPQLHPTIWRCRWGSSGTLRASCAGWPRTALPSLPLWLARSMSCAVGPCAAGLPLRDAKGGVPLSVPHSSGRSALECVSILGAS